MRKSLRYLTLALFVALLAVNFTACGKKAPPTPPRYMEPPMVRDLMVEDEKGDVITLGWSVDLNRDDLNLSYFHVYMERQALATLCLTCPPNFVRIGESRSLSGAQANEFAFQVRVEEGYRYVFMVRGLGTQGMEGADSNYAVFQF